MTLDEDIVTVEVLESTAGLGLSDTRVRFLGEPLHFAVGPEILGRVFDGVGRVVDGGPPVSAEKSLRIDGLPISPAARATPRDFIETGISTIDLMNSLVRGVITSYSIHYTKLYEQQRQLTMLMIGTVPVMIMAPAPMRMAVSFGGFIV